MGTGRFASPLGIKVGVEPADNMRKVAQNREINVLAGVAEKLPFNNSVFDFLLMFTTVRFLDDIHKAFSEAYRVLAQDRFIIVEAYRVLAQDRFIIVAFVDRKSRIGKKYSEHSKNSVFYKDATIYSVNELIKVMKQSGFHNFSFRQTIFGELSEITELEPVKSGYGHGSFVVIRGKKDNGESRADDSIWKNYRGKNVAGNT